MSRGGYSRRWTSEEEDYLREAWGEVSLPSIARHLNRTEDAVVVRKCRLKLGAFFDNGGYVTLNQLSVALGYGTIDTYKLTSWVKNRGFPVHTCRLKEKTARVVYLEEFWQWAEKYRAFIDWSRVEPLALGEEPTWVAGQRKADYEKSRRVKTTPWSKDEDAKLIKLLNEYRYTWQELSKVLGRSCGAIQRRVCDLGIKTRPIKADNMVKWTPEEHFLFAELIKQGCDYESMGDILGKSGKALRGKTWSVYQTENLDAVMRMIGNGTWGDGAPPKEARKVGRKPQSKTVKLLLSELCGALIARMHQISPPLEGWTDCFQRFSCMNWDDITGCLAGGANCDKCKSYQRIRPQYCKRCGGAFLQKRQTDLCAPCRKARISQHMRKHAALQRIGKG